MSPPPQFGVSPPRLRVAPRALLCCPPRASRAPQSSSTTGSPVAMAAPPAPAVSPGPPGGLVAVAQVTSTADKEHNWRQCSALVRRAAAAGARAVFLPEAFDFIGDSPQHSLALAEPLHGDTVRRYRQLARPCPSVSPGNVTCGSPSVASTSVARTGTAPAASTTVTCCWTARARWWLSPCPQPPWLSPGALVAAYRKLHLFDAALPGAPALCESSFTNPGRELLPPIDTPVGKVGLAVCYDLRFPELAQALRGAGAQILTYPSAFTVPTGAAHWEVLLCAHAPCVPLGDTSVPFQ
ncbi:deaminated glutathione amidase isoform X3 [Passer montanus]|uniref:deaminated glutathione amidase isoform X3 n=1 Tax=Passer montanus TaxID=9160 RepID=UPI001961DC08|nr:deaminated glutathione amidase isoform X3 [Passer montanus]